MSVAFDAERVGSLEAELAERDRTIDELCDALVLANDQQLAFYELARLSVSTLEHGAAEQQALTEALRLIGADAAVIVDGHDRVIVAGDHPDVSNWLLTHVGAVDDDACRRTVSSDGFTGLITRVAAPTGGVSFGFGSRGETNFGTADLKLVDALVSTMSTVIEIVALHEQSVRQSLMEHEHRTAAALAQAAIPRRMPAIEGATVAGATRPARSAGGDFFTVVEAKGVVLFAVGDVAGKGLPAALLMTNALSVINACFARQPGGDPARLLSQVSADLWDFLNESALFVTIALGTYEPSTGRVRIANAGHSPVSLVRRNTVEAVPPSSPPVGVLPGPFTLACDTVLEPGDLLVAGSDGLTEQEDVHGTSVGDDAFNELLGRLHGTAADVVSELALRTVEEHAGSHPQSDDRTILVISRNGEPSATSTKLTVAADFLDLRRIGPWLHEVLPSLAAPTPIDEIHGLLELAIHELCTNIVDHAYENIDGDIAIGVTRQGDVLEFEWSDRGVAFDAEAAPEPSADSPTVRGYGLHIIKQIMSAVAYERINDENRWKATFLLPEPSETPATRESEITP